MKQTYYFVAKDIGVDAGVIMIGDIEYLDQVSKKDDPETWGRIFNVEPGTYKIDWVIDDTWNGDIHGSAEIKIQSGTMFVCDPCYIIGEERPDKDEWMDWLNKTDYCRNLQTDLVFVIDSMGGDGNYEVELNLTKIKD